ncbi:hypothetical protein HDV05_007420 [Chytridiales sp. JEL 0842]|nr:hypothetical protein HDV05_007420 [Chytridiales sp. JEL 0842]
MNDLATRKSARRQNSVQSPSTASPVKRKSRKTYATLKPDGGGSVNGSLQRQQHQQQEEESMESPEKVSNRESRDESERIKEHVASNNNDKTLMPNSKPPEVISTSKPSPPAAVPPPASTAPPSNVTTQEGTVTGSIASSVQALISKFNAPAASSNATPPATQENAGGFVGWMRRPSAVAAGEDTNSVKKEVEIVKENLVVAEATKNDVDGNTRPVSPTKIPRPQSPTRPSRSPSLNRPPSPTKPSALPPSTKPLTPQPPPTKPMTKIPPPTATPSTNLDDLFSSLDAEMASLTPPHPRGTPTSPPSMRNPHNPTAPPRMSSAPTPSAGALDILEREMQALEKELEEANKRATVGGLYWASVQAQQQNPPARVSPASSVSAGSLGGVERSNSGSRFQVSTRPKVAVGDGMSADVDSAETIYPPAVSSPNVQQPRVHTPTHPAQPPPPPPTATATALQNRNDVGMSPAEQLDYQFQRLQEETMHLDSMRGRQQPERGSPVASSSPFGRGTASPLPMDGRPKAPSSPLPPTPTQERQQQQQQQQVGKVVGQQMQGARMQEIGRWTTPPASPVCSDPFATGVYYEFQGRPYCESHYPTPTPAAPPAPSPPSSLHVCPTCILPVQPGTLNTVKDKSTGQRYHPTHYVCGMCQLSMEGGVILVPMPEGGGERETGLTNGERKEHIPESTILLFKLPPSINIDYTLSQQFLSNIPSTLEELQFASPDRVESLVPGGRWLQNPFDRLLDLNEPDDSKQHIELLAIIVEDSEATESINDPLPSYIDVEKVSLAPPVSDLSKELNDMAIACLESQLPANHSAETAQVLGLIQEKATSSIPKYKLVGLPKSPPYCVIRHDSLPTLYHELRTNQAVCIIGEMGLGKTSLATQFARECQESYEWIFFLSCSTTHDCLQGFRILLDATGSEVFCSDLLPTASDIRSAALRWLKSNSNYLLIIDNADDMDIVRPLFEQSDFRIGGSVMITSRNIESAAWASEAFFGGERKVNTLPISVWSRLDTITYLKQRIPFLDRLLSRKEELESLNDICENYLNDYPIIVEQFASLMVQLGGQASLKTMKSNLESAGWSRLLDTAGNMGMGSFAKLFQFSLESLVAKEPVGPVAVLMICIIGTFSPSPLPYSVFLKSFELLKDKLPPTYSNVSIMDCLKGLRSASIVKTSGETDNIQIHSAFHQIALKTGLDVLGEIGGIIGNLGISLDDLVDICWLATSTLIPAESIFGRIDITAEMTNNSNIMAPHLLFLSGYEEKALDFIPCLEHAGWVLCMSFSNETSLGLLERALHLRTKQHGSRKSLDAANLLEALSNLFCTMGLFERAESVLGEAFETKKSVCGTDAALPLISTYEKFADLKLAQCSFVEAARLSQTALNHIRNLKGDLKNEEGAFMQMSLGQALLFQGKSDGVLALFEEAMETYTRLGNQLGVAQALDYIGLYYQQTFQEERAIDVYHEVRQLYLSLYKSHKNSAVAMNTKNLGSCYYGLGLYHQAYTYYQQFIEAFAESQGTFNDLSIAITLRSAAMCKMRLGEFGVGLEKIQSAKEIYRELGLERTARMAECIVVESKIQTALGSLEVALSLVNKGMEILNEVFNGGLTFWYLSGLNWRGCIKMLMGDLEGAKEDLKTCIKHRTDSAKTKEDRWVAETMVELGCVFRAEGRLEEALSEIREAREIHAQTLPKKELFENVNSSYALGLVYKDLGKFEEAKVHLEESLEIMYKMLGEESEHPKIATIKSELASLK